jgi:hypothetical protein
MSAPHPRPWHRSSVFGDGRRVPLDREQRAQFKAKLKLQRRPGRLTLAAAEVGRTLCEMLGSDGRLEPSQETIAARACVEVSTVQRSIKQLAAFGFLTWTRRLARCGSRVWQTSSAYVLTLPGAPFVASLFLKNQTKPTSQADCMPERSGQLPAATLTEIEAAREAMERRRRVVEAGLAKAASAWG